MTAPATQIPVVLCFGGHDPTGGAGLQADIESIAAQGSHAATIPTCLTVQNTHDVLELVQLDSELMYRQAACLLSDMAPAVLKVGLIGSEAALHAIEQVLDVAPTVPLVVDPVLRAGGGCDLAPDALVDAVRNRLLPRARLITPNQDEARRLSGCADLGAAIDALLATGCKAVLLTGADANQDSMVVNRLYLPGQAPMDFHWPRVAGHFHGSGCTLAAACAARLALGETLVDACRRAQSFTWQTLSNAHHPGAGQSLPGRFARPE